MHKKIISIGLATCLVFTNVFSGIFNGLGSVYAMPKEINYSDFDYEYDIAPVQDETIELEDYLVSGTTSDGIKYFGYDLDFMGLEIIGYEGKSNDVVIPSKINGISVKEIRDEAFKNCSNLKSIKIPKSVNRIGAEAFRGCKSLTKVEIADGLNIGDSAFEDCKALTSITLPTGVKEIGDSAFKGCNSLKTVKMPKNLEKIGDAAFEYCSSLTSIKLPNTVKSIGDKAFWYCSKLASLNIPSSLASKKAMIYSKNKFDNTLKITEDGLFEYMLTENNAVITRYLSKNVIVKIPAKIDGKPVTEIGNNAFEACPIESIEIPDDMLEIGNMAFYNCKKLKNVVIPKNLTKIGKYAFSSCMDLESLEIPEGVKLIKNGAFEECSYLRSVKIEEGVEMIASDAFAKCVRLRKIKIPASVKEIGNYAFYRCNSLKKVYIVNGLSKIGEGAFYGCKRLESVKMSNKLTTIGMGAFFICSSLKTITIPSKVATIRDYTFAGCTSLKSVEISEGVKKIGESAFGACSDLAVLKIPKSVTSIHGEAFYGYSPNGFNGVLYVYKDSYAEKYAKKNKEKFKVISSINSSKIKVSPVSNRGYTGKNIMPTITVKNGTTKLVKGVDYTVAYSNNKYIGTATATIKGINKYDGSRKVTFKILPKQVTDINKASSTTSKIKLSWPKVLGNVKYEVYRATSKTGKYYKIARTSNTYYTDTKRKSKKTYYYKVRAYKVVNSKYYYGKYSDVFAARTK